MTLEHKVKAIRSIIAALGVAARDLENDIVVPALPRLLFGSPVTGQISTTPNPFGLDWFDATGYCMYYTASGAPSYHTGCDLNRPNYQDSGVPVYAAADGIVKLCGQVQGWQGDVVIVEHRLEDGSHVWTRYAHIKQLAAYNDIVRRGQQIGTIADYNKDGPKSDHLHFDVALIDLSVKPIDWPGLDKMRLTNSYANPEAWLKARAA